ncbi:unnamed protein product [Urochloa humidicola]
MAGQLIPADGGSVRDYGEGVTFSVVVTCLMAASCGLILGYDSGVSGGVTQMESFLSKFFPEVLRGMKNTKRDAYCKYDNQCYCVYIVAVHRRHPIIIGGKSPNKKGRPPLFLKKKG